MKETGKRSAKPRKQQRRHFSLRLLEARGLPLLLQERGARNNYSRRTTTAITDAWSTHGDFSDDLSPSLGRSSRLTSSFSAGRGCCWRAHKLGWPLCNASWGVEPSSRSPQRNQRKGRRRRLRRDQYVPRRNVANFCRRVIPTTTDCRAKTNLEDTGGGCKQPASSCLFWRRVPRRRPTILSVIPSLFQDKSR